MNQSLNLNKRGSLTEHQILVMFFVLIVLLGLAVTVYFLMERIKILF